MPPACPLRTPATARWSPPCSTISPGSAARAEPGRSRDVAALPPRAGEVVAPQAVRRIVPSAAGEGSLLIGVLARGDTPTPALPRKRERECTVSVASTEPDLMALT